ncbi:hypothetical protein MJD09_04975, partial [bacterium]|nr:hypothetical protein [bacterium]
MMVNITEAALQKFKSVLEEEARRGQGIRITAQRGATPFSIEYGLSFVSEGEADPADRVFE